MPAAVQRERDFEVILVNLNSGDILESTGVGTVVGIPVHVGSDSLHRRTEGAIAEHSVVRRGDGDEGAGTTFLVRCDVLTVAPGCVGIAFGNGNDVGVVLGNVGHTVECRRASVRGWRRHDFQLVVNMVELAALPSRCGIVDLIQGLRGRVHGAETRLVVLAGVNFHHFIVVIVVVIVVILGRCAGKQCRTREKGMGDRRVRKKNNR